MDEKVLFIADYLQELYSSAKLAEVPLRGNQRTVTTCSDERVQPKTHVVAITAAQAAIDLPGSVASEQQLQRYINPKLWHSIRFSFGRNRPSIKWRESPLHKTPSLAAPAQGVFVHAKTAA